MEVESGSERFRVPKTSFQENVLVNDAVPASTNWTLVTKGNFLLGIKIHPADQSGALRLAYNRMNISEFKPLFYCLKIYQ